MEILMMMVMRTTMVTVIMMIVMMMVMMMIMIMELPVGGWRVSICHTLKSEFFDDYHFLQTIMNLYDLGQHQFVHLIS